MYKLGGSDEYVSCPYNPAHEVQRIRYQAHILKCKKQYPDIKLATCFYNYRHLVKPEDMPKHLMECGDKQRVEGSRYGSSKAPSSFLDFDNCETESGIGFGSEFRDALPSDDDRSVASRSSSFRSRGNALLKTGPLGNLSRYAMNERKPKWENTEVDFLEVYDQVASSKCDETPVTPDTSPVKYKPRPIRSSSPKEEEKMQEENLKPVAKKLEVKESKPLQLPRKASKEFVSPERISKNEMKSKEDKCEKQNQSRSKIKHTEKPKSEVNKKKVYPNYYDEPDNDSEIQKEQEVDYDAFIFNPMKIDNQGSKSDSSYLRNKFLNRNYSKMIGRGRMICEPDAEKPIRNFSLLPDASDLDDEVPPRPTEDKLFLKSGYSLFPDHENDGSMNDEFGRYDDADEEDDPDDEEEEDSNESPLLIALNRFAKKKEAMDKEKKLSANKGSSSSDETSESTCKSVNSVIHRKPPSPMKKKGSFQGSSDDELLVFGKQNPKIYCPMGRGFRFPKKENVRPLGRGFNIL